MRLDPQLFKNKEIQKDVFFMDLDYKDVDKSVEDFLYIWYKMNDDEQWSLSTIMYDILNEKIYNNKDLCQKYYDITSQHINKFYRYKDVVSLNFEVIHKLDNQLLKKMKKEFEIKSIGAKSNV